MTWKLPLEPTITNIDKYMIWLNSYLFIMFWSTETCNGKNMRLDAKASGTMSESGEYISRVRWHMTWPMERYCFQYSFQIWRAMIVGLQTPGYPQVLLLIGMLLWGLSQNNMVSDLKKHKKTHIQISLTFSF